MASIMKRGNTYSVRYNYKDHAGKPCKGWETFKTKAEAQERKITVEKELLDGTFLVPDTMTVEEVVRILDIGLAKLGLQMAFLGEHDQRIIE